jgi:hypothetical protein
VFVVGIRNHESGSGRDRTDGICNVHPDCLLPVAPVPERNDFDARPTFPVTFPLSSDRIGPAAALTPRAPPAARAGGRER